jgi:hypothetical protein
LAPSPTIRPSGRSAATIFQVAADLFNAVFSHCRCAGPNTADAASIASCRLSLFAPLNVRMSSANTSTSGPIGIVR